MTILLNKRLEAGPLKVGEPVYTVSSGTYGVRASLRQVWHVTPKGYVDVVYSDQVRKDGKLELGSPVRYKPDGYRVGSRSSWTARDWLDFDIAEHEGSAEQKRRLGAAERITDELSRMFRTRRSSTAAALEDIEAAEALLARAREALAGR